MHPAESSPAQVPQALLARLTAQYVPEDDKNGDISETDKIRRYRAILREGAWAERQYPAAGNLYRVRELMLAAARGLTALEGTAENGSTLMGIVRRLADSNAPPEARLPADVLLFRARIAEQSLGPAEADEEIERFIARYADTPAAARALMGAVELAAMADCKTAHRRALRRLDREHFHDEGVCQFLEAQGMAPFHGRLMPARLIGADGSALCLPRDMLGKLTILHFWTMGSPGLIGRHGVPMTAAYEKLHDKGLQFVGVNLDTDRAAAFRFAAEQKLPWPQTSSGLGAKDPTFLRYRIPTLPAWWIISPDGRALANNYREGFVGHTVDWAGFVGRVENTLAWSAEAMARAPYYRSGEFLLDCLPPPAGDLPADVLAAAGDGVDLPPSLGLSVDEKAARLRSALALARRAEKDRPTSPALTSLRSRMLAAARWLAVQTADANAAAEARQLAGRVLSAAAAPPAARVLADYVRLSDAFAAEGVPMEAAAKRIAAFRAAHADGPPAAQRAGKAAWAADMLAAMLAVECGDEPTRVAMVLALGERAAARPKVCGMLRDFFSANVDARSTQLQYQPVAMMAAGGDELPYEPHQDLSVLPRLDGGAFRLGRDGRGKCTLLQFWSAACPPADLATVFYRRKDQPVDLDSAVTTIAVNLDRSRADVEKFLAARGRQRGWVYVFSGKGFADPLARALDVYGLPRTVLLDAGGTIFRWGTPVQLGDALLRAGAVAPPPPRKPSGNAPAPPPPASAPAAEPSKELSLELGGGAPPMKLAPVSPGEFRMGPSVYEIHELLDEPTYRLVTLTKPFHLAVRPVTRGQFAAFVKDANYATEAERDGAALLWTDGRWTKTAGASWRKCGFEQADDHPVVCVSFADAEEFCRWLARRSGRAVCLPTEAQWEYACRAGSETLHAWGGDPNAGAGWCNAADRSAAALPPGRRAFPWDDGYPFTSPVGRFRANAFGLHDMMGNVWEWTADWFDKGFQWRHQWHNDRYDPVGPSSGLYKAVRGGSWLDGPAECRLAARRPEPPRARLNILGFRVAIAPP